MNATQKRTAEKILAILEKQRFANWYGEGGEFDDYIRVEHPEGHKNHISKEMILDDIERLFQIGDMGEIQ